MTAPPLWLRDPLAIHAENADRGLVVQHGRIVETGTHDELLAHNGTYASLYRMHRRDIADLEELEADGAD